MTLPNFLVIGAPKAGTTSLHDWLGQHPDVFMPRLKEPRFLAWHGQNSRRFPIKSLAEYEALFDGARESAVGEASPDYLQAPDSPRRIHALVPRARLIVSLRNPVEQVRALYEMGRRDFGQYQGSFREALESDRALRRGYHAGLRAYLDLFGPAAVRVILFEDLVRDPAATVRGLFEFLGVDPDFRPDLSRISNPGGMPRSPAIHALLIDARVRRLAQATLPRPLIERARDLRNRNLRKQPMPAEDRALARELFREDILRTQDLIGRDLTAWLA